MSTTLPIVWVICLTSLLLISTVLLPITAQGVEEMSTPAAQDEVATVDSVKLRTPYETNVFVSGQGGYHTYRIPAIVVSQAGTILAFCEGRKHGRSDSGDIDLLLRRSLDNGQTWQPKQVIWDNGEDTIGNPCPVVDRSTGTIWVAFCRNSDRVYVTKSTDDGNSWTTPVEITNDVKLPKWGPIGTGPGHGAQLRSGRLLIPCWAYLPMYKSGDTFCFYSDDHGASWMLGGIVGGVDWGDECQAVEIEDDVVYLSIRSGGGKRLRAYSWSHDGGATWSDVQWHEDVPEPSSCQGSVIRLTDDRRHDRNRVVLANPAGPKRERLTIRLSYDECRTWNAGKVLWPGPAAYSDLCVLPDMTICCLYEAGYEHAYENIRFARFTLEWLTDGADKLAGE